jgi:hypothetical protein
MEQRTEKAQPARVEAVRQRIEDWRRTRERRTRMPETLWTAAAQLAREHGLWAMSQALRLSYESLRQAVERSGAEGRRRRLGQAGFVELDAEQVMMPAVATCTVVELSAADGMKLTIRFGARRD